MRRLTLLALIAAAGAGAQSAPIYGLVKGSTAQGEFYHFGYFDLQGGTGSQGSQSFAWTNLSTSGVGDDWTNLAKNPANGQLYLQTNFSELRTISNTGVLGAVLGVTDAYFGMTFALNGSLYGLNPYVDPSLNLEIINPSAGTVISSGPAGFNGYSQMGGGLTAMGNDLYFTGFDDDFANGLLQRVGQASGVTMAGPGYDVQEFWTVAFSWNNALYLINEDRLYAINTTSGFLTPLGTITNLPALQPGDVYGFSGAVGNLVAAPIPEPSTYGLVLGACALALAAARRRRRPA